MESQSWRRFYIVCVKKTRSYQSYLILFVITWFNLSIVCLICTLYFFCTSNWVFNWFTSLFKLSISEDFWSRFMLFLACSSICKVFVFMFIISYVFVFEWSTIETEQALHSSLNLSADHFPPIEEMGVSNLNNF